MSHATCVWCGEAGWVIWAADEVRSDHVDLEILGRMRLRLWLG